jgi:hypothetical protein
MVTRTAEGVSSIIEAQKGMTLRDYFAAAALQGILANPIDVRPETVVKASFEYADAMLAARKENV